MAQQIVFALVTFLHDLFTVLWVGGMITLGLVVFPSARRVLGQGVELKRLVQAIGRRLSVLVYVSIVGLVLTGVLLSRRAVGFQGPFSFANAYSAILSVKHMLVVLMVVVAIVRQAAQRRAPRGLPEKLGAGLLLLNVALGIVVLLLSGFSAAFSAGPPA